jgi:uncharacterized membrane protein YhaH (DUF805 family)
MPILPANKYTEEAKCQFLRIIRAETKIITIIITLIIKITIIITNLIITITINKDLGNSKETISITTMAIIGEIIIKITITIIINIKKKNNPNQLNENPSSSFFFF